MLGFPAGWVTSSVIGAGQLGVKKTGLPRTAQLRVLGNAVQPQVAELAARLLLLPLLDRELELTEAVG